MDAFYKTGRWNMCQNNFVSIKYIFLSFLTVYIIIVQKQHYCELLFAQYIFRIYFSIF